MLRLSKSHQIFKRLDKFVAAHSPCYCNVYAGCQAGEADSRLYILSAVCRMLLYTYGADVVDA